jgi:hypothetical protein
VHLVLSGRGNGVRGGDTLQALTDVDRPEAAEVHTVIVTVSLVHLACPRVLERGQLGHHLGHRRLGHRSLLSTHV